MASSLSETCIFPLVGCIFLSLMYVLSLYVWQNAHQRNEPSVIKQRFLSVLVTSLLSPFVIYIFSRKDFTIDHSIFDLLGIRLPGLLFASTLPLILTMVLFLGPLVMQNQADNSQLSSFSPSNWLNNLEDLVWLRDHLVAPISEELTFRACMLPLLLQCTRHETAVFLCPLFFGLAHFHHAYSRVKSGYALKTVLLLSSFQFLFTTVFGAYSAFLFLRTGHLVAPFLAHAFCNHLGFPNFQEIIHYSEPRRTFTAMLCFIGFGAWCLLLFPFTNPKWYDNTIYWQD